jgi:hypothetical protein
MFNLNRSWRLTNWRAGTTSAPPAAEPGLEVLFAGGFDGIFLDPSDTSTMFQDSAGTVPVTATGDPVGLILDKSGNSNNFSAPSAAVRPLYQTDGIRHWLEFDGVDDELVSGRQITFSENIFFASGSRLTAFTTGFPTLYVNRNLGPTIEARFHPLVRHLETTPNRSALRFGSPTLSVDTPSDVLGADLVMSVTTDGVTEISGEVAGVTASRSATQLTDGSTDPAVLGAGTYAGRVYGVIHVNKMATPEETTQARDWFASKSGGIA